MRERGERFGERLHLIEISIIHTCIYKAKLGHSLIKTTSSKIPQNQTRKNAKVLLKRRARLAKDEPARNHREPQNGLA